MTKRILLVFIALLLPAQVLGISPKDREAVIKDTVFYDANSGVGGTCASAAIPSNVNLSQAQINGINANKNVYLQASQQTGVPWELLAAIHFKETAFRRYNPGNGQGVYQILSGGFPPAESISEEEFLRQTIIAAQFLQNIASTDSRLIGNHKRPLTPTGNDPEAIKDIMFSYNGRARLYAEQAARLGFNPDTQPYEGSPYVMNNFDDKHQGMLQDVIDQGVRLEPAVSDGGFVIYAALVGLEGLGCGQSGQRHIDIAAAEIGVSEADSSYLKYTSGRAEYWCADFVSWVFNEAGTPFSGGAYEPWQLPAVVGVRTWFQQNGIWVDKTGATEAPRPGDVVFFYRESNNDSASGNHIGIVEKVDGDDLHTIEGNTSDAVRRRVHESYMTNSYVRSWGRLK